MNLLSASTSGVVVDIVFFLLIIGGIFAGAQRGFISGVSRLAGTLFAIAFALFFCVSFSAFLENNFGMTSSISDGLTGAFSNLEMLNTDISAKNLETALEEAKIPGFIASIIVSVFADMQLPEGTTIAMLISPIVAHWISVVISFVLLIILIKLAVWLVDKIFSRAAEYKVKYNPNKPQVSFLSMSGIYLNAILGTVFWLAGIGTFLIGIFLSAAGF